MIASASTVRTGPRDCVTFTSLPNSGVPACPFSAMWMSFPIAGTLTPIEIAIATM